MTSLTIITLCCLYLIIVWYNRYKNSGPTPDCNNGKHRWTRWRETAPGSYYDYVRKCKDCGVIQKSDRPGNCY